MSPGGGSDARVRVWDPVVRFGHWLLVLSVSAAWLTRHSPGSRHEIVGYVVLGIVAVRALWGVCGSRHARFSDFVFSPAATIDYARDALRGREPRYLGHNPLGGWMIVALLTVITVVCVSGWLYTTDRFWGIAWVDYLHRGSTYLLLGLVGLHLAGVLFASLRHRENLVGAMFNGRKRALERPGDPS